MSTPQDDQQGPDERVAGDAADTDAFVSDPAAAERATKERMDRQAAEERRQGGPIGSAPGPDVSPGSVPAPEQPQPVPDVQPVPGVIPDPEPSPREPAPGEPLSPTEPAPDPGQPEPLDPPRGERPPL